MANETTIHIRLDEALKSEATAAFAADGLSLSEGVRLLLAKVAKKGNIPPEFFYSVEEFKQHIMAMVEEAWADTRPLVPHEEAISQIDKIIQAAEAQKRAGQVNA